MEGGESKQRSYVLVRTDKLEYPICIYKINETDYCSLFMKCTHSGCELNPQSSYLVCPCHGSEFSSRGVVQNPPAEQNLKTFETTTDNENVYVQL